MNRRPLILAALIAATTFGATWFAFTDTAARMWAGFCGLVACWQLDALALCCGAVIAFVLWSDAHTRKAWAVTETRTEINADSLAYWEDTNPELAERVRQIDAANAYRRNFGGSPANQQTPAPWFDGGSAA